MSKTKEAPAPKARKAAPVKSKPTQDQIATRAYEIYLELGSTPGDPMQDCLSSESELPPPSTKSPSKSKVITSAPQPPPAHGPARLRHEARHPTPPRRPGEQHRQFCSTRPE